MRIVLVAVLTAVLAASMLASTTGAAWAQSTFEPDDHDTDWTLEAVEAGQLALSPLGEGITTPRRAARGSRTTAC